MVVKLFILIVKIFFDLLSPERWGRSPHIDRVYDPAPIVQEKNIVIRVHH